MKRTKGSLTLEAVISFTVFVSFMFMLLLVVKMSMTVIALDSATSETAKQIATSAYPVGLFNKLADETGEKVINYEQKTGFADAAIKKTTKGFLNLYIAENSGTDKDVVKADQDGALGIIGIPLQYGKEKIADMVMTKTTELIGEKGNEYVRGSIAAGLDDYGVGIDYENLELTVCKFPLPKNVYETSCNSDGYTQLGLTKADFNAEDVVIGITYDYEISLPFLPTFKIKLKSVAIEHPWINGGNGETVSEYEGITLDSIFGTKRYYVGVKGNSKCYHKSTCITLWKGYSVKTRNDIKNGGYKPCKVCKPGKLD